MNLRYEKLTPVSLKGHPTLNEKWVQDRIAEDPEILGLGDVISLESLEAQSMKLDSQERADLAERLWLRLEPLQRWPITFSWGKVLPLNTHNRGRHGCHHHSPVGGQDR